MKKTDKNIAAAVAGAKRSLSSGLILGGLAYSFSLSVFYFLAFWLLDGLLVFGYGLRYASLLLFFLILAASLYFFVVRKVLAQASDVSAALALQKDNPKLKDSIINSILFAKMLKNDRLYGMSAELAKEYICRADRALAGRKYVGGSPFKANAKALLVSSGLLLVLCFAVFSQGSGRTALIRLFSPSDEVNYEAAAVRVTPPELGEVRIKIFFPAYTGLKPAEINDGGNAVTLKGSTLLISGVSSLPLKSAVLKYKGKELNNIAMSVRARLYPEVKVRVLEDFDFRLEALAKNGLASSEKEWHSIKTIGDEFPRVKLIFPAQDLLVAPKAELKLVYEYGDDFGVSEAALVFVKAGRTFRVPLEHNSPAVTRRASDYAWNIAALALSFGETIEYWIDVADNDTESGPKHSISGKRRISVPTAEEYLAMTRSDNSEKEKELLDSTKNLYTRNEDLLKSLEKYKRNGKFDIDKLRGDLDLLFKQMAAMQRNLLDMAQILPAGAMQKGSASDIGLSDMGCLMRQLREALDKGDYDAGEKIAKELSAKINDLLKKMAAAMKSGKSGKKSAGIEAGSEAKEMLREEQAIFEETSGAERKITSELLKAQDEKLKKALELQQKAAEKSAALMQGIAQNREPQPALILPAGEVLAGVNNGKLLLEGKKFKESKEQIAEAAAGSGKLSGMLKENAGKLQTAVSKALAGAAEAEKAKDMAGAEKIRAGLPALEAKLKEAVSAASGYAEVESLEKEVLSLLSGKTKMTPEETARMAGTKARQAKNISRMQSLSDKLGEAQKSGVNLESLTDQADAALKGMGEAEENLGGGTLKGALAGEQEALEALTKLSDEAGKMAGEGGEGGITVVMPGQGQSGILGTREGKVSVPREKDYKPPKEFRQDIMDSLKDKLPEKDKEDIEEYYKRLLR